MQLCPRIAACAGLLAILDHALRIFLSCAPNRQIKKHSITANDTIKHKRASEIHRKREWSHLFRVYPMYPLSGMLNEIGKCQVHPPIYPG